MEDIVKYISTLEKCRTTENTKEIDEIIKIIKKSQYLDVVLDTTHMDEDFCDYSYLCPTCNMALSDANELIGVCDCGQKIITTSWTEWKPLFEKSHVWSKKNQKWVKKRRKPYMNIVERG